MANALRDKGRQRIGDTTNVSVVDAEGNACVITTTLGLGAGVWPRGLGLNLNSMLGEGELITGDLVPGRRMASSGRTPRTGGQNHGTASIESCGHGKTPRR